MTTHITVSKFCSHYFLLLKIHKKNNSIFMLFYYIMLKINYENYSSFMYSCKYFNIYLDYMMIYYYFNMFSGKYISEADDSVFIWIGLEVGIVSKSTCRVSVMANCCATPYWGTIMFKQNCLSPLVLLVLFCYVKNE